MDTREWIDASTIPGNAPQPLKQSLVDLVSAEAKLNRVRGTRGFEPEIASRIAWTEISILPKAEEPERLEGRVAAEITVREGTVRLVRLNDVDNGSSFGIRYVERTWDDTWRVLCAAHRQVCGILFRLFVREPRPCVVAAPRCPSLSSTSQLRVKATLAFRSLSASSIIHLR